MKISSLSLLFLLFSISLLSKSTDLENSLNFDGVNDYINIGDNDDDISAFTIETWIKCNASGNTVRFICGKGIEQMELHIGGIGAHNIRFIPVPELRFDAINVLSDNTWTHIAAVYDPSNSIAKLYVNGIEATLTPSGSASISKPCLNTTSDFHIGNRSDNSFCFEGCIDEFRIWNIAKTSEEINSTMNTKIFPTSDGLKNYYNFDQGIAEGNNAGLTTLIDLCSNNDGTLYNFALEETQKVWDVSNAMWSNSGTALCFNGINNYVDFGDNDNSISAFTIETWVYWNPTSPSIQFICGKSLEQMELHTNPSGSIRFIPTSGVYLDSPTGVLSTATWIHVAAVYDPSISLAKLYIDGTEVILTLGSGGSLNTPITNTINDFKIGTRGNNSYYFKGEIDEFHIWNTAKSQAEIGNDMGAPFDPTSLGLINYYNFEQSGAEISQTETNVIDLTTNNNGSLMNFTSENQSNWVAGYALLAPLGSAVPLSKNSILILFLLLFAGTIMSKRRMFQMQKATKI